MTTITIEAEEELMAALRQVAQNQATTIEAIVKDTLRWHLPSLPATDTAAPDPLPMDAVALQKRYPFIGIWQTGNRDLSEQTEDILAREMGLRRIE